MQLIISVLFIFEDKNSSILDDSHLLILLNDNGQLPSINAACPLKSHEEYLRTIISEYLNYDYSFLFKILADVKLRENEIEVVYKVTSNYSPGVNKIGKVVTLKSISEGEIFNQYGKSISGSSSYFR